MNVPSTTTDSKSSHQTWNSGGGIVRSISRYLHNYFSHNYCCIWSNDPERNIQSMRGSVSSLYWSIRGHTCGCRLSRCSIRWWVQLLDLPPDRYPIHPRHNHLHTELGWLKAIYPPIWEIDINIDINAKNQIYARHRSTNSPTSNKWYALTSSIPRILHYITLLPFPTSG